MSVVTTPVKQGISAPTVTNIPDEWSKTWFRNFITSFLVGADIRNVTPGPGLAITGNVSGNSTAATSTVTIGQAPIAPGTVLGNAGATTASPSAITQVQLTSLINLFTNLLSGDVPASGGGTINYLRADGTWDAPPGTVISTIPNNTVLGNISGSTALPVALTQTQLTALINTFTATLSGAVTPSGGGTTNFLRADGTWTTPSGGVSLSANNTWTGTNNFAAVSGISLTATGVAGQVSHLIVSNNTATFSGADLLVQRAGSTINAFSEGPSLKLEDTSGTDFSVTIQASGGQPEIWAGLGATQHQLAFWNASRTLTLNAALSGNSTLNINGAATGVALFLNSGLAATVATDDFTTARAGSTINSFAKGPSHSFVDTTNNTGTIVQQTGGQTEIWQSQNVSGVVWSQVLKILTTGALQSFGPIAGTTVDLTPDKGTFTATFTGFTTAVTCTATWNRTGNIVAISFPFTSGTSNATTFTITGLPAAITPNISTFQIIGDVENSGTFNVGLAQFTAGSSTISLLFGVGGGAWTNSGTKGFGAMISYMLNN